VWKLIISAIIRFPKIKTIVMGGRWLLSTVSLQNIDTDWWYVVKNLKTASFQIFNNDTWYLWMSNIGTKTYDSNYYGGNEMRWAKWRKSSENFCFSAVVLKVFLFWASTVEGINDWQAILFFQTSVGTTNVFRLGGVPAFQSISIVLPTWIRKNKKSLVSHLCPRLHRDFLH